MTCRHRLFAFTTLVCLSALLYGCEGNHAILNTAGEHARHIGSLWWLMLAVCVVMYLLVLAFLMHAGIRARRKRHTENSPELREPPRLLTTTLAAWVALIVVGLVGLTLASYITDSRLARAGDNAQVQIEVTGYQWWWRVRYKSADPSQQFETANELHLPAGVPVTIQLASQDVIHSFWIPNLHGKQDLIPGRNTEIQLKAEREGVFRGECAEFCGAQHAHMNFDVVVESREAFDRWSQTQRQSASEPVSQSAVQGREIFMRSACVMCHSIRGTLAAAGVGPDLTHVASRRTLAAGTLTNNKGNLAGWLADPQGIKPGTHMPYVGLSPHELNYLVDYLLELK